MSTTSSKPKTSTSTSKSHSPQGVHAEKESHTAASVAKDSSSASSTTAHASQFYCACRNNEIDVVTSLLPKLTLNEVDQIEPNGSTALHAAAYYGNEKIVQLLLSKGAQRAIKNRYGNTPYDEAKTDEIKKLFKQPEKPSTERIDRFTSEKGPSYEWIFVKGDPSSYASFNRESLLKCETEEEFKRLCRGIQQHYVNEGGPLTNVKGIGKIRRYVDRAIEKNDPTQIVRAYTAATDFYPRLNVDMAEMPTHWSGIKHERSIASIMLFHPVFQSYSFTGRTFRGMNVSLKDLQEYVVDSIFMNKTFLSTSKERTQTKSFFLDKNLDKSSKKYQVLCIYQIKYSSTALAIENISKYPDEKEVLILPYASFKVKSIREIPGETGTTITEMEVEEEDPVKWTLKKSHHSSQSHTSVKKVTGGKKDDAYDKMFKDSQEKGAIDSADLVKWKQESFGIDPAADTYAKMWNDAKKGKLSKSDVVKWKKECGAAAGDDDSDLESIDGENNPNVFTASNEQSYVTAKSYSSNGPFDKKFFLSKLLDDSDE